MHIELSELIYGLRSLLLVAAFAGFAWALLRARREAHEANAQVMARLETALGEIRRVSGQVTALGVTVESLATKISVASVQPAAPAPRAAPSAASVNTRGYETAIRMARSGASVDEIVASCGTTRAEAKLLRRLHECGEPRRADTEDVKFG